MSELYDFRGPFKFYDPTKFNGPRPNLEDPRAKECGNCESKKVEILFLKTSNGMYQFKAYCLLCGEKSGALPYLKVFPHQNSPFYQSREWLELRYRILRDSEFACMACNRGKKDGVKLHVDHIKPKSKYPSLALDINNLQVLCEDCNIGKSNKYVDDFREKGGING